MLDDQLYSSHVLECDPDGWFLIEVADYSGSYSAINPWPIRCCCCMHKQPMRFKLAVLGKRAIPLEVPLCVECVKYWNRRKSIVLNSLGGIALLVGGVFGACGFFVTGGQFGASFIVGAMAALVLGIAIVPTIGHDTAYPALIRLPHSQFPTWIAIKFRNANFTALCLRSK